MTWTEFMDMSSGGGEKLDWPYIFIEAPGDEAKRVFAARFGRNPDNVTCDCCGPDFSVSEYATLEEATAFNRGLRALEGTFNEATREWEYPGGKCYLEPNDPVPDGGEVSRLSSFRDGNGITLDQYLSTGESAGVLTKDGVKVIYAADIADNERTAPKGKRREKVWVEVDE